jgi:hypothetical protein
MKTLEPQGRFPNTGSVANSRESKPNSETNIMLAFLFLSGAESQARQTVTTASVARPASASFARNVWQNLKVAGVLGCLLTTAIMVLARIG